MMDISYPTSDTFLASSFPLIAPLANLLSFWLLPWLVTVFLRFYMLLLYWFCLFFFIVWPSLNIFSWPTMLLDKIFLLLNWGFNLILLMASFLLPFHFKKSSLFSVILSMSRFSGRRIDGRLTRGVLFDVCICGDK